MRWKREREEGELEEKTGRDHREKREDWNNLKKKKEKGGRESERVGRIYRRDENINGRQD